MDWRTASYSTGNGACVETASSEDAVMVRDTTDRDGGMLSFTAGAWAKFTASLK
jgi:hypothetical protein